MSVRGQPNSDPADACPFVAFEDERDERSTRPDHRHRCYAELRPAPRALAHQEAHCLSSSFAACPTFRDWARREAARARPPVRPADVQPDDVPAYDAGYGRHQSDWTAPPPWAVGGGSVQGAGAVGDGAVAGVASGTGVTPAGEGADAAGAAATRSPGGERGTPAPAWTGEPSRTTSGADAPGFLAARDGGSAGAAEGAGLAASAAFAVAGPPPPGVDDDLDYAVTAPPSTSAGAPASAASSGTGRPAGRGTPRPGAGSVPPAGRGRDDRATSVTGPAVSGPSWERPRRYEAYPTLRTRVGLPDVPRIALGAVALLVAAVALFLLPTLVLRPGGGGDTGGGAPTGSPSASSEASASVAPTPLPSPTAQVYIVVSGDTFSRIAAKYKVTLPALKAANPQIANIDKLQPGDKVNIPIPAASDVIDGGAPSASPSGS